MKKHPNADEKRKNLWPALPFFVKSGYNTSIKYNKKNGNEKIDQAVCQLQQEPTQEQLAHTLTVIRRRMRENGQVVVAVEPNPASEQMQLRALRTADGASWWYAFTSFEEEMKGAEAVQSTFLVEFEKLLDAALQVPEIQGIILNPWNRTIQLDKTLLRIIKG